MVVGKLSVLEGTGNSPGLPSTVSFCRFYCYGKYKLCAMIKKGFLLCASKEFCGGIEEICRNKTYICATDKVPWSQSQCIASLTVVTYSQTEKCCCCCPLG